MNVRKSQGDYNVVVIGGGTAGLVTAVGTAGLGGRVALIERGAMGGDCLNFGCIPSKALLASARQLHNIRRASDWGIGVPPPEVDLERIFTRMRRLRAQIAPHDSQARLESLGVAVFRGEARFISPHEIQVGGATLRARHFVIATGTRAALPHVDGLDDVRHLTNETVFDELIEPPRSLLLQGGGPIGCELAQAFARFGVRVTLVQKGPRLLPREDADASALVRRSLEHDGVEVLSDAIVRSVQGHGGRSGIARVASAGAVRDVAFDALLLAVGRQPNVEALDLEAAGVRTTPQGVAVDAYLQTSQAHIHAAGDVTGRHLFTHMADHDARVVVRNILVPLRLLRQRAATSVVPWCTYTDPEVARVGLSEDEAKQQQIDYDVYRQEIGSVDRAVVDGATQGYAKVLTQRGGDRILGAAIAGEHAGDLLSPLVLAMQAGLGLGRVAAAIHPYPTLGEVTRKLGDAYSRTRLTPRVKRFLAWLYRRQLA